MHHRLTVEFLILADVALPQRHVWDAHQRIANHAEVCALARMAKPDLAGRAGISGFVVHGTYLRLSDQCKGSLISIRQNTPFRGRPPSQNGSTHNRAPFDRPERPRV